MWIKQTPILDQGGQAGWKEDNCETYFINTIHFQKCIGNKCCCIDESENHQRCTMVMSMRLVLSFCAVPEKRDRPRSQHEKCLWLRLIIWGYSRSLAPVARRHGGKRQTGGNEELEERGERNDFAQVIGLGPWVVGLFHQSEDTDGWQWEKYIWKWKVERKREITLGRENFESGHNDRGSEKLLSVIFRRLYLL